jgi:hypothetical protein
MKYLPILATLFISFGKGLAQNVTEEADDPDSPGFRERVGAVLSATLNTFQNVEIPPIGSGEYLSVVECDEITIAESTCTLVGGLEGVNVCREIAGSFVTVCAPKILGNYVGANGDTCGCCGAIDELGQRTEQKCMHEEETCLCGCQEGSGILVKHDLLKAFGRQISWNGCYTPTIAANVLAARAEFSCYEGCEEAIAAREAEAAAVAEAETEEAAAAEEVAAPAEGGSA